MELLRGTGPLRLEFLNNTTQAWVEQDYHRRSHSEIGCSPIERLLAGPEVSRPAPDMESLNLAFTRQITRKQRLSDSTGGIRRPRNFSQVVVFGNSRRKNAIQRWRVKADMPNSSMTFRAVYPSLRCWRRAVAIITTPPQ